MAKKLTGSNSPIDGYTYSSGMIEEEDLQLLFSSLDGIRHSNRSCKWTNGSNRSSTQRLNATIDCGSSLNDNERGSFTSYASDKQNSTPFRSFSMRTVTMSSSDILSELSESRIFDYFDENVTVDEDDSISELSSSYDEDEDDDEINTDDKKKECNLLSTGRLRRSLINLFEGNGTDDLKRRPISKLSDEETCAVIQESNVREKIELFNSLKKDEEWKSNHQEKKKTVNDMITPTNVSDDSKMNKENVPVMRSDTFEVKQKPQTKYRSALSEVSLKDVGLSKFIVQHAAVQQPTTTDIKERQIGNSKLTPSAYSQLAAVPKKKILDDFVETKPKPEPTPTPATKPTCKGAIPKQKTNVKPKEHKPTNNDNAIRKELLVNDKPQDQAATSNHVNADISPMIYRPKQSTSPRLSLPCEKDLLEAGPSSGSSMSRSSEDSSPEMSKKHITTPKSTKRSSKYIDSSSRLDQFRRSIQSAESITKWKKVLRSCKAKIQNIEKLIQTDYVMDDLNILIDFIISGINDKEAQHLDIEYLNCFLDDVSDSARKQSNKLFMATYQNIFNNFDELLDEEKFILNAILGHQQPPENELQKSHDSTAHLSEHQLRVQASLQRLNIPDWYRQYNSTSNRSAGGRDSTTGGAYVPGSFTRKRETASGRWAGLNSKTTSLSSLGTRSDRSPVMLSPSAHSHQGHTSFSRWSTSQLNSSQTSPSVSSRSSFNRGGVLNSSLMSNQSGYQNSLRGSMRTPYLGWRSQERLSQPRTPAERLASSLKEQNHKSRPNDLAVTPEIQSSIKEKLLAGEFVCRHSATGLASNARIGHYRQ